MGSDLAEHTFGSDIAGAESNVARYGAALGFRSGWISRLGRDMAGSLVHGVIADSGVDTSAVQFSESAPTGVMLRDSAEHQHRVQYYRRGSAASFMNPETVPVEACLNTRMLHLTGITPALSQGCLELVRALLSTPSDALKSFDVNWRPALWPDGPPTELFAELGNLADVVLVGRDEAEEIWGVADPAALRSVFDRTGLVVVKDEANGAYAYSREGQCFEPSLRGPVVVPRGAGDAFAAGLLCGILRHPDQLNRCLRLGHIVAMSSIGCATDVGELPAPEAIEEMLDADAVQWQQISYPHPPHGA